MSKPFTLHERAARHFAAQGETFLMLLLLAMAAVLVYIALQPGHVVLKAITAAWVLLP